MDGLGQSVRIKRSAITGKVRQPIGEGGSAKVFLARYDGDPVAIKTMKGSGKCRIMDGFWNEVETMSKLCHPRIVRLFGVVDHFGISLVLEHMPGGSLYRYYRQSPEASIEDRIRWSLDIAYGMALEHGLLRVKVSDFGSAVSSLSEQARESLRENRKMSLVGTTRLYLAPELHREAVEFTTATDAYAYGVILTELATWKGPFGYTIEEIHRSPRFLQDLQQGKSLLFNPENCSMPDAYKALARACLDEDPDLRPNFVGIIQELRTMNGEVGVEDLGGLSPWSGALSPLGGSVLSAGADSNGEVGKLDEVPAGIGSWSGWESPVPVATLSSGSSVDTVMAGGSRLNPLVVPVLDKRISRSTDDVPASEAVRYWVDGSVLSLSSWESPVPVATLSSDSTVDTITAEAPNTSPPLSYGILSSNNVVTASDHIRPADLYGANETMVAAAHNGVKVREPRLPQSFPTDHEVSVLELQMRERLAEFASAGDVSCFKDLFYFQERLKTVFGSAIHYAASCGFEGMLRPLVAAGEDLKLVSWEGTPLHAACLGGFLECVRTLVDVGADPNLVDKNGNTPLACACRGGHLDVVRVLIRGGAMLEAANLDRERPLMVASRGGFLDVVRELILAGAEVNAADDYGETALFKACNFGHVEVLKILVVAGGDVNTADAFSWALPFPHGMYLKQTPIHTASRKGHVDVVKILIQARADLNVFCGFHTTPLHEAALNGHVDVVKALVEAKANVDAKNRFGRTALWIACDAGHDALVGILMKGGCDMDLADRIGTTPLMAAAENGHNRVVETLLRGDADPNVKDSSGRTAMQRAECQRRLEVIKTLRAHKTGLRKMVSGWFGRK
ncbi:Leucine-rich repeat serine/threonine-protein kinase 2 [Phlyctochytrium planicorne]|nr:Leucine-rich repeat serine/threonine-protein kinase 2 [Phlyctochytrium planicorne]